MSCRREVLILSAALAACLLSACPPVDLPPAREGAGDDGPRALADEKVMLAFSFVEPGVAGVIDEGSLTIGAVVPSGTDRTSLTAVYDCSPGARVTVDDTEQESGRTVNDFTEPRLYVVTAEDGSTQAYTVKVSEAASQEKKLTAFSLQCPGAYSAIDEARRAVRVRVPPGTNVGALVAVFSSTGERVSVSGVPQESGVTQNDFSGPVEYEVIAQDGSSCVYTILVTDRVALVVNELDVDQVGTDNAEYIELFSTGPVDLMGVAVVLLNGGVTPGQEYARIDLAPVGVLPAGCYVVIAGPLVSVPAGAIKYTPPGWESSNRMQNGPNDAVMIWDSIGLKVVDTVSYAGVLHRALVSGAPGEVDATEGAAGAPADSNALAGSISRFPDGTDTGQNGADFRISGVLTPGAPNQ